MKSTYKLFGTYWDGMKPMMCDEVHVDSGPIQSTQPISFRMLLSIRDEADLDRFITPCETKDELAIVIDYWTETYNPVLHAFLKKRLGQMVTHLSEKHFTVHCIKA